MIEDIGANVAAVPVPNASFNVPFSKASTTSAIDIFLSSTVTPSSRANIKTLSLVIPGNVVFLRGAAAAVLPIVSAVERPFEKLVILCGQYRVPAGGYIYEACAGMADGVTGDLKGVMIKEMEEELY